MKRLLLILICWIIVTDVFSQTVLVKKKKLSLFNTKELLIPIDSVNYLYEKHYYFYYHGLVKADTVKKVGNKYIGKEVKIKARSSYKPYEYCDSVVNEIRNFTLFTNAAFIVNDTLVKYIGNDDVTFAQYVNEGIKNFDRLHVHTPTLVRRDFNLPHICFDDFKILNEEIKQRDLAKIQEIYNRKIERLNWIKQNYDSINTQYILTFLHNSSRCDIDKEAVIDVITANAKDFINVSEQLYGDFSEFKWKLYDLPKTISLNNAISALEKTKETKNRDKLISYLQKQRDEK